MDKGKRQRKKENAGKRKRGVGIGIKIMVLLLLLAITAISCVGVLVWTLQSVIGMSDHIRTGCRAGKDKHTFQTVHLYQQSGAHPCHDYQQCDHGYSV